MFLRAILEVMISFSMTISLLLFCSKKKSEKDPKVLPIDESTYGNVKNQEKKKTKGGAGGGGEQKKEEQVDVKVPDENEKQKSARKSKTQSQKLKTRTTQEGDSSSGKKKKKSTISSANGEVPNEVKAGTPSGKTQIVGLNGDVIPAELCGKMDKTIVEMDNHSLFHFSAAIHDRVTRVAETDLIFDPKVVKYQGNVDEEKNKSEIEKLEKEMEAACAKHERRNKDPHKKSEDSKESVENLPVPADRRVKMKPEACVLYETKEQQTDDDEMEKVDEEKKEKPDQ